MKREICRIENLGVRFQRWGETVPAITDLSLTVNEGDWVMLIGHNGSGKSTLLRVLAGQIVPACGTVSFGGKAVGGTEGKLGYPPAFLVEQNPLASASAKLTLLENLQVADAGETSAAIPRRDLSKKYQQMLASVGLSGQMNQLARYLSGGERQLLSLLIAQLRPSPVLLLDEPLTALDPAKGKLCMQLIADFNKTGRTIIHVTHDHALAFSAGSRVIELERGRIKADTITRRFAGSDEVTNHE